MPSAVEIEAALRERLQATHVVRARPDAAPPPPLRSAQHPATLTRLVPQSVADVGDGCGSKFEVEVESPQFEGKALLARHRLVSAPPHAVAVPTLSVAPHRPSRAPHQVNEALKEEMKTIHALSIKRAVPPPATS